MIPLTQKTHTCEHAFIDQSREPALVLEENSGASERYVVKCSCFSCGSIGGIAVRLKVLTKQAYPVDFEQAAVRADKLELRFRTNKGREHG